jgi:hypothetical protein
MEAGSRARGWVTNARRAAVSVALAAMVLLAAMADSAAASAVSRGPNTAQAAPADGPSAQIGSVPHRPGLAHRVIPGHVVEGVRPAVVALESAPQPVRLVADQAASLDSADRRGSDARAPPVQGSG